MAVDSEAEYELWAQSREALVSGVVVRIVSSRGVRVRESFMWLDRLPEDPQWYAGHFGDDARIVDSYEVEETSGWGPLVAFRREVPGGFRDDAEAQAFFAGNRALDQVVMSVNLAHVEPMEAERAWELLADSASASNREQVLQRALSELTVPQVEQFCARVERWARELDTDQAVAIAGPTFVRGSDGFRAWRFGVIARGSEFFEAVRAGHDGVVPEQDVEFGFALGSLGERVVEDLTGVAPEFVFDPKTPADGRRKKRLSAAEQFVRERDGDGTVDQRPGPRDARAMLGRGLHPCVVTSRFIASAPHGYSECLVVQHIDTHRENVARHVRDGARTVASGFGGVVCTTAEWDDTGTDLIQGGLPLFDLKRPWKGTLDEYLEHYRLA